MGAAKATTKSTKAAATKGDDEMATAAELLLMPSAHKVMSAYTATKKRRVQNNDGKPAPAGEWALAEAEL